LADVEVVFEFIGVRQSPTRNGYRADHKIREDYLTCGMHQYERGDTAPVCGKIRGTIKFITPEAYPHTCWKGKVIPVQEGTCLVGYATIERVLNPLLDASLLDK